MLIKYKLWHYMLLVKTFRHGVLLKIVYKFGIINPNNSHETILSKAMINIVEYAFFFDICKDFSISSMRC
jgi:hypothetical protein